MANTFKILGQLNPSPGSLTALYTVPSSTQAVLSTVFVANRDPSGTLFRMAVAVAGAAADSKHYLAYDTPIGGNEVVTFTAGITLGQTDVFRVYATSATLSFNAFGQEIT